MKFQTPMKILGHEITVHWTLLMILDGNGKVVNASFTVEKVDSEESSIGEVKTDSRDPKPQYGDIQGTIVTNIARMTNLDLNQIGKKTCEEFIAHVRKYSKLLCN